MLLSVLVAEDGTPSNIRVLRPLGLGLAQKAVEAVSQWRFQPSMANGRPARARAAVEVQFSVA